MLAEILFQMVGSDRRALQGTQKRFSGGLQMGRYKGQRLRLHSIPFAGGDGFFDPFRKGGDIHLFLSS